MFSCTVCLLWVVVAAGTVKGALSKKLFYAPCLQNLKQKGDDSESEKSGNASPEAVINNAV
jgi:hypothetical protein